MVRKILIGLGGILLVIIALVVWLGVSSAHFRTEQEPFVQAFVTDLSKRWDVSDVYDRSANVFLQQVSTPQGRQVLSQFKQLGALRTLRDLELRNFNWGTNGQTGLFTFKGTFENGDAVLDVTVVKKGDSSRVLGLYISGMHVTGGTPAKSQV